jgi:hypothetical protein
MRQACRHHAKHGTVDEPVRRSSSRGTDYNLEAGGSQYGKGPVKQGDVEVPGARLDDGPRKFHDPHAGKAVPRDASGIATPPGFVPLLRIPVYPEFQG